MMIKIQTIENKDIKDNQTLSGTVVGLLLPLQKFNIIYKITCY